MQVICKRSMLIRKPSSDPVASKDDSQIASASATYHQIQKGEKIKISPSNDPQNVPDWVRDTVEFAHATSDGTMVEVQVKTKKVTRFEAEPVKVEEKIDSKAAPKTAAAKS